MIFFSKKCSRFLSLTFLALKIFFWHVYAEDVEQVKKGNFSLPSSQQPGPLFGFGQNVVDAGTLQLIGYLDYRKAHHQDELNFFPSILYGITDRFALFGFLQAEPYRNVDGIHTSRVSQVGLQFEYSVYANKQATCIDELTIVWGSNFSVSPDVRREFFAPSFFLGATLSRMTNDWYLFASPAAILPTRKSNSKSGNTVTLQAGIGRNIPTSTNYILLAMLELNLISSQRNQILGSLDQDSGGQILFFGPTLWFATRSFFAQAGVIFPAYQHVRGKQNKSRYLVALNIGITF